MYKGIKLLSIMVMLMSTQLHAQLNDLSSIIDNASLLNNSDSDLDLNQQELDIEPLPQVEIESEDEEFLDPDYGYSGKDSFIDSPKNKLSDQPLEYFGYSYFSNPINPISNIPVPPDYMIGPGDVINVILFGNDNNKFDLRVNRDGNIFFPELGPINVTGLTFENLRELISNTIATRFIGTEVSITLGRQRTIDIFILGGAKNPGMYSVSALSTITNALFRSGGVDKSGSLRNIKLKRDGKTIINFDLYKLFLDGDTSKDTRLMQGDVIFVEPIGKTAGIRGEVSRPGIFELKEGETYSDLIRFAGSFKPKAKKADAELTEINQSTNAFSLKRINLESKNDISKEVNNGDILSIYPVNENILNAILVSGHYSQPGFYPYIEGMRILDLIKGTDELLEMTDINYVLIARKDNLSQQYSFLQIDLEEVIANPMSEANIFLQDQDEIVFFPSFITEVKYENSIYEYCNLTEELLDELDFEDEETSFKLTNECRRQLLEPKLDIIRRQSLNEKNAIVLVYGGVHFPGDYPYTKNMTLNDLIDASGGIKNVINSAEIEITRRNKVGNEFISSNSISSLEKASDRYLQKMDTVTVKGIADSVRSILIKGEVYFPGLYPITDEETITSIINRAGGIKETADIKAAIFQRDRLKKLEKERLETAKDDLQKRILLAAQTAQIGQEEIDPAELSQFNSVIQDLEQVDEDTLGRLVIDLNAIINQKSENILVEDGDVLTIPKSSQSISVIGEVYVSSTHIYDQSKEITDYINLSGGITDFGDQSNIYIVKSDGRIVPLKDFNSGFFRSSGNDLTPGDTIVIPLEISSFSNLKAATEVSQIVYQMAIAAAAVNSFGK